METGAIGGTVQPAGARAAAPSRLERFIQYPLVLMVIALVMVVTGMVVAGILVAFIGAQPGTPEAVAQGQTPLALLWPATIAAFAVIAYWLYSRFIERDPVRDFEGRGAATELAGGIVGGAALFALIVGVVALLGGYRIAGEGTWTSIWAMLGLAVMSGVTEELMFRGILFRLIEKVGGSGIALAATSGLFGFAHAMNPGATPLSSIAIAIEAGVLLGAVYMLTRRLWAAIGLHGAWNFTQGWIFDINVSGFRTDGIVRSEISGPELLTGGSFGLEASVPAMVIATSAGLVILYLAAKRGNLVKPIWVRKRQAAV